MGFNRNSEAFINALVRALSLHNDVVCLITVLGSWTSRLDNKIFIGNCVRLSSDSMPTQHQSGGNCINCAAFPNYRFTATTGNWISEI